MEKYSKRFGRVKTAVFWDMDGCQIPEDSSVIDVSQKIRSALEKICLGTVTIYAYGDKEQIQSRLKSDERLEVVRNPGESNEEMDYRGTAKIFSKDDPKSSEIVLNHTPAGEKDARLERFLIGLFCWALDNPAPANLMIVLEDISAQDYEFLSALYHFSSYNIILVQPKDAPAGQLFGAVREKFLWESLSEAGKFDNILEPPRAPKRVVDNGKHINFLRVGAGAVAVAVAVAGLALGLILFSKTGRLNQISH